MIERLIENWLTSAGERGYELAFAQLLASENHEICSIIILDHVESIGFGAILGEDDAFAHMRGSPWLRDVAARRIRPLIEGELVRDWASSWQTEALFPYPSDIVLCEEQEVARLLWPVRTTLAARRDFTKQTDRNRVPLSITLAFVATHNHFVLDRGGKVYAECGRPYWEYHQIPVDRNRVPLSITLAFVATHNHDSTG